MSEVTVYLASDLHPGEHVVLQPDYDSVVFDLAALREELAHKTEAYQGAHMMCTDLKASLAAAEQRNAALLDLLRECQPALDKAGYSTWQIDDAIKPTESGASE